MKISIKSLAAMGLAAAMAATSYMPAQAMPLPAPVVQKASDVEQVQYRRYDRRYYRDRPGYYHGHRGYRHHRPGYRYHNGFWFPLAAFTAGAIIGGAVAAPPAPRASGLNPRHYQWCSARYRSYDAYSNTFQPYNGPRQLCYSPYY
ncbi:BA14K family protein [Pseudomonas sp. R2.Fl]|nr:BA14K family protein [Pseudomonas sp. R2.Fl]